MLKQAGISIDTTVYRNSYKKAITFAVYLTTDEFWALTEVYKSVRVIQDYRPEFNTLKVAIDFMR